MATLRHVATGGTQLVEPEHAFGRAPTSSTRIDASYVSAHHASMRWVSGRWVLRDLGSRNGTFVNGDRVAAGEERPILTGTRITFGKPQENAYELVDEAAPSAMAVPIDGGTPRLLEGELLAVPSEELPEVTIYRGGDTPWLLERADEVTTPITNSQTFTAGGRTWRFCCSDAILDTILATAQHDLEVRFLQLGFSVSRDEEHVALSVTCGGMTFDLGARSHNYLLLTLARRRLADRSGGLPETSCGWLYQEDLVRGLNVEATQVNLDVYRIRQQFSAIGVPDAANIVERRPRTRQLRIGSPNLAVVRL
jgi:FHA domain